MSAALGDYTQKALVFSFPFPRLSTSLKILYNIESHFKLNLNEYHFLSEPID